MTWSPASGRGEIEARLRALGTVPDEEIDLAEAALLLAALDRPRTDLERYRAHLGDLGRAAGDGGGADTLEGRAEALGHALAGVHGYRGDRETYDDLRNADLIEVIERRKGLPVALGILYIATARARGWDIAGLDFPGHFLLRLALGGRRLIIDPFDGGAPRDTAALRALIKALAGGGAELEPRHYETVGNRAVLLRLRNNSKQRLLAAGQPAAALEVVESMLLFSPGLAGLWREAGIIHANLGNLRAATLALEQVMELEADPAARNEAARLLRAVRARIN